MTEVIVAEGLERSFGPTRALDGLDLTVAEGSVLGLLGPNGSGKTTAVRVLSTLLRPDAGRATVAGLDVVEDAPEVRRLIGLSGQYAAVDGDLSARENLRLVARLHHLGRAEARRRADELVERFGLAGDADRKVREYSGGMRRRVDLACSVISRPRVLVLDEPTTGLDVHSRQALWDMIFELVRDGTTLLLTTQYLEEADQAADRIAVLSRGRIIASGTPAELKSRVGAERLELTLSDGADLHAASAGLGHIAQGEITVNEPDRVLTIPVRDGAGALVTAIRTLDDAGLRPVGCNVRRPTLDEAFLMLTEGATGPRGTHPPGTDPRGPEEHRELQEDHS